MIAQRLKWGNVPKPLPIQITRQRGVYQYGMVFLGKSYRAKRRRPLLRKVATYNLKRELVL